MLNHYEAALKRLFDSGPLPKMGLERMELIAAQIGHPESAYPIFHVAGTNGKGSTCAFLESILRSAGFKTGLYTSPHLVSARERIQVNRELISERDFVRLEACVPKEATFFERMTAMAFLCFAEQKVDIAVVEVGLGGRLDATNIVRPVVCGISKIDLDHLAILGPDLASIAREKAGIIKPGVPVCWSPQEPEVGSVLREQAQKNHYRTCDYGLGLQGLYQSENASLAASMIAASGLRVSEETIKLGLFKTHWPARYELISQEPCVLIDGAHNPAGTKALINALKQDIRFQDKKIKLHIGLTEGHNSQEMAQIWYNFTPKASVSVGQSKSLRALPVQEVGRIFSKVGFENIQVESGFNSDCLNIVTGSLYWAGEIRSQLTQMPKDTLATYY